MVSDFLSVAHEQGGGVSPGVVRRQANRPPLRGMCRGEGYVRRKRGSAPPLRREISV